MSAHAKPQMRLDESLPQTHSVPINPETGEVWSERFMRLQDIATLYRYSEHDDEDGRAKLKAEYDQLREGVNFREEPQILRQVFLFGAEALRAVGYKSSGDDTAEIQAESFLCHPDTWAALPEAARARFDVQERPMFTPTKMSSL